MKEKLPRFRVVKSAPRETAAAKSSWLQRIRGKMRRGEKAPIQLDPEREVEEFMERISRKPPEKNTNPKWEAFKRKLKVGGIAALIGLGLVGGGVAAYKINQDHVRRVEARIEVFRQYSPHARYYAELEHVYGQPLSREFIVEIDAFCKRPDINIHPARFIQTVVLGQYADRPSMAVFEIQRWAEAHPQMVEEIQERARVRLDSEMRAVRSRHDWLYGLYRDAPFGSDDVK